MRNLTGILLLVFLTLTGAASAQEAEERSRFVTFIEEQISSPDQQIRLNGLSGTLSSSVSLDSITIADRDGVWLTIVEPQLIWERSQLLRGRLEVDRLSAQRIEVTRLPKPAPNRPDMQARQFAIPELPVAVRIGALTVDQVLLSEVVLGFAVELSVDGSFSLEEGGFNADIEILRLDGPGGVFNVATQYDPESNQVEIATRFDEPANGVLANMIGIPDRPALTFTAEGAGPVDNLAVDINLDVDGRSLSRGSVVTSQADDGTNIAADLVGQFETLVSPRLQRFFAGDTGLMAQATIFDDGALNVPSFRLSTAEALISGNLQRAGTGEVEQSAFSVQMRSQDGREVTLPFGEDIQIQTLTAQLDYQADRSEALRGDVAIDTLDLNETQIGALSLRLAGITANGDGQRLSFDVSGRADQLTFADEALTVVLRDGVDLTVQGAWQQDAPIILDNASLSSTGWELSTRGQIDGTAYTGRTSATISSFAALAPVTGFSAAGGAELTIDGVIDFLTGGFDYAIEGDADLTPETRSALTNLLAGGTEISGQVLRDSNGTRVNNLSLNNPQIAATLDGLLSPDGSDFDVQARLADIALVAPDLSGAVNLDGTISGAGPDYRTQLRVQMPNGSASGYSVKSLRMAFDGIVGTTSVNGALDLDGILAEQNIRGDLDIALGEQNLTLSDVDISYAGSAVRGDLTRRMDSGLLAGNTSISSDDMSRLARLFGQSISGSLLADVSLAQGVGGGQSASFDVRVNQFNGLGGRANSVELVGQANRLFGTPTISVNAQAADAAFNDIQVSALDARAEGPLEQLQINANAISLVTAQTQAAAIAPINVELSAIYAGAANNIRLNSVRAVNNQSIEVTANGLIALRSNSLDILVEGGLPLAAIAQNALSSRGATADGNVRFSAAVVGPATSPSINGLISVSDAFLRDPLSNLEVRNVNLVAGLNGQSVQIREFNGRVGENGRLSGSGSIGIANSFAADLRIRLIDLPYTDGRTVATNVNGDLTLTGPLLTAPRLGGQINLGRTEIIIPEVLGAAPDLIEVTHVNPTAGAQETLDRVARVTPDSAGGDPALPLALDLRVSAPAQIFVRGRGLDAELGGSIRLQGSVANISPTGRFDLRRGRLEILSKRLDFDRGSIVLAGDLNPFLNFVVNTQAGDVTATITVSGRPSDLNVAFSSSPSLPEDEIVARIIFNRGVSELSPVQLLQLANAVTELSGGQAGGLFSTTRSLFGLDDLDIVDDGEGNIAVRAGTYINEKVYLGVEAGRETEATINLDITESLTARGSVSNSGETKLGIFFERDY